MSFTLVAPASHVIEVKHSRFIAHAAPVSTPEAALAFLRGISDPVATHNCWAYRIGSEYRSSDDNEPSGTAGRPILAAIDGQDCDRVMVVVTRWYGGIKLGAGGLVRAYGGAASECLRLAAKQAIIAMQDIWLAGPFDIMGDLHAAVTTYGAEKREERFDASGVSLHLRLPAEHVQTLKIYLRDATRNRVRFSSADAPDPSATEPDTHD